MTSKIKPLANNVLFQFTDTVHSGMFYDVEKSGIIVGKNSDNSAKQPRWGTVLAVGPDVKPDEVAIGNKILIESLRWTEAYKVDGISYWFTRVNEIMCVQD